MGNSFSYFNNGMANHVSNLLRAAGKFERGKTHLRLMTLSGSRLYEHRGGLEMLLPTGGYDVVIMQGHSNEPIATETSGQFTDAVVDLSEYIRDQGAEPVLLMTWQYQGSPEMTASLRDAYTAAGNSVNALVMPVGLAFQRAIQTHPEIDLYSKDIDSFIGEGVNASPVHKKVIKHPSMAGTYLAACVVYASLFGQSPEGLGYTAGLDSGAATALQKIAYETVGHYY